MKKIYHMELAKIIRAAKREGMQMVREGSEYFVTAYIINNVKYRKISDVEYQIEAF